MGHFIGNEKGSWYVHDDGTVWDSAKMLLQFNAETLLPIVDEIKERIEAAADEAEVSGTVEEFRCPHCEYKSDKKRAFNLHFIKKHRGKLK